jgi:hypothetical protein
VLSIVLLALSGCGRSRSALPSRAAGELPDQEVFCRGGAAIIEPTWGEVIAGPLYDREGMLTADCDLREGLHAKRWFDSVGHYSREDVLMAEIDTPYADGNTASPTDRGHERPPDTTARDAVPHS